MSNKLYGDIIELSADGQPVVPEIVLAYRSGNKQGVINNVDNYVIKMSMSDTDEITFDVHKNINGTICEFWNDIKNFKLVYVPHYDTDKYNPWYELEVAVDEDDETIKHCTATHVQECELGQLTLNGVEINTENDIACDDYVVTTLYNKDNPKASLIDRILADKASHYTVHHVDTSIANIQRTFSWDGVSIKGAFDDIAKEIECLFVFGESDSLDGKIHRTISVYDLDDICLEDGCNARGSFANDVCSKCNSDNIKTGYGNDSGIFLSKENFTSNISYSTNKDSVKNCFRLVAGDDLMTATVRNINPNGSQYMWYLSDELREDMSSELRNKLSSYDEEYNNYNGTKQIPIPESVITEYNDLVDRYQIYDETLSTINYPILGYPALMDFYYQALNMYSLLKTSLAPASKSGNTTTAAEEIKKMTASNLSPIGVVVSDIDKMSTSTANSYVSDSAKVFTDTALYRVSADGSYSSGTWTGTITLKSYTNEKDVATTPEIIIKFTSEKSDYLKSRIEIMLKNGKSDATGTVALFKMNDTDFVNQLNYYSMDNLSILEKISRGCLDVLIEQGVADKEVSDYAELYNSLYVPYFNKHKLIEGKIKERENELSILRGNKEESTTGILDVIEQEREIIVNLLDVRNYLGDELWEELCSFRRDDEYKNENFISDGLTDAELIEKAREFHEEAKKEIIKSATLQHKITCNLNNLLLVSKPISENDTALIIDGSAYYTNYDSVLSPLLTNFETGNWVYIEIDDKIYKLRLTEYKIDYDNLCTIEVQFSDVVHGLGYLSDVESILSKAQSMSTSYSATMKRATKGSEANKVISNIVENGLYLTNNKIVDSAYSQNLLIDSSGLLMRKQNDLGGGYESEQVKIINHGLYFTDDGWESVKTGIGSFMYLNPETNQYEQGYGVIANKLVGDVILGNKVGIYNSSGSIKMDENGLTITSDSASTNSSLFKLRRKNSDGSYTDYVSVTDDGEFKIQGSSIEVHSGDSLDSYFSDTVQKTVDNLQVGGRNLISNLASNWQTGHWSAGDGTYTGYNGRICTKDGISVNPGETYAITIYLNGTTDKYILLRAYGNDGSLISSATGITSRIYTVPDNVYELRFVLYDSVALDDLTSGAVRVKVEKGNKATDWTPAPEDINSTIDTAKDAASKTATNYLNFSSNGLIVGDHTASTLGNNVLIDSDSVNIRSGETVLASYGSTTTIGNTSGNNVLIDSDSVDIRNGSTVLASYGSNIKLGNGDIVTYIDEDGLEVYDSVNSVNVFTFTKDGMNFWNDPTSTGNTYKSYFNKNGIKIYAPTTEHPELYIGNDGEHLRYYYDSNEGSYILTSGDSHGLSMGRILPSSISTGDISTNNLTATNTISAKDLKATSTITATGHIDAGSYLAANTNIFMGQQAKTNSNYVAQIISPLKVGGTATNKEIVAVNSNGVSQYFGYYSSSVDCDTVTIIRGKTLKTDSFNGWAETSDERLKKDFTTLDKWDDFYDNLEPVAFRLKYGSSGRFHIGFKAQDVERALTDTGLTNKDFGGIVKLPYSPPDDDKAIAELYKEAGINPGDDEYNLIYTEFVALNTYEIQKIKKENKDLKNKISNLESRIEAIEKLNS